jgi:hypothetical protein
VTLQAPNGSTLVDDTNDEGMAVFPNRPVGTYTLKSVGAPGVPDVFVFNAPFQFSGPHYTIPFIPDPIADKLQEFSGEALIAACDRLIPTGLRAGLCKALNA